ncbi:RNA polymerase sigma factor SigJ [Cohnella lupini]|uniref:RNA polymerase sigma-70 factor (ECF subfamily) n=1 Tax=Cohnella lupini TaxID=1294267 RepID=A0A3D9ICB5_9BACL|nr:RNA polymerase sigma factor SigJ [Cohnella lupini]RED59189.1 RNA polymerase sigma-70 factor (ECF subfamily) [Cohnella lupini]
MSDYHALYDQYRPLLFSIAYRMLGLSQDAEDVVQDVFVAVQQQNTREITNIKAYLCKLVTNRCLNELKSSRRAKTAYIGPWLPEPIVTAAEGNPEEAFELKDDIAYAYLVVMRRLTPMERAVFVLRETLGFSFEEIGEWIGKSEVNCRQLFSRGKRKLDAENNDAGVPIAPLKPEFQALSALFSAAFLAGDIAAIVELLSEDAILLTDGGGKVNAAINPIIGRHRVQALLTYSISNYLRDGAIEKVLVNGRDSFMVMFDGKPFAVYSLALTPDGSAISRVYVMMNPDKLQSAVRLFERQS